MKGNFVVIYRIYDVSALPLYSLDYTMNETILLLFFRNVCYSKENDVFSQRNPWCGEEDFGRSKTYFSYNGGSSKIDNFYSSCPSFKSLQSNISYHPRKLNRS